MSSTRQPQLGSVVWSELEDANGFRKVRPAVSISLTADITAGQPVRLVAVTTRLPTPLPDDHVLLPWDRQGKARSGLRQKCVAVCSWLAEVPLSAVQQVVGLLPPPVIAEILAKVPAASPPSSSSPGTGGPVQDGDSAGSPGGSEP